MKERVKVPQKIEFFFPVKGQWLPACSLYPDCFRMASLNK